MSRIVILGAGVMGSAMSIPAAAMGHAISLVGTHLDGQIIASVQTTGMHPRLGVKLPAHVSAHAWTELGAVLQSPADLIILGVSSSGVDWAIDQLGAHLKHATPILMITKGLQDSGSGIEILPDVVATSLSAKLGKHVPVMAVGGPCIAGELAVKRDTAVVMTGRDAALLDTTIGMLAAPFYHARASSDVVGVELCAAFKNFFALGVGWAVGRLEKAPEAENAAKMHNLASGIFAQSLREMGLIVTALGGSMESVVGLPGAGDLYVTCLAGRNSRMGRLLGLGHSYTEAKRDFMANDTVEGADLARSMGPALLRLWSQGTLSRKAMPLSSSIHAAICDDQPMVMDWQAFGR